MGRTELRRSEGQWNRAVARAREVRRVWSVSFEFERVRNSCEMAYQPHGSDLYY